jgi:RHS repeat-associated protein
VTGCRVKTLTAVPGRLLIALALATACTAALADTYQYDERGDLETLTTPRGVRTYQYDEVRRLKVEQGHTGNREHVYDRNGNRATDGATAPGTPTTAIYAEDSNRLATINGAAVSIDAAGQITNDGVNTYTWDDAGRLKTVSRAGQLRATYHYDHKHRRTRKVTTAAAPQGVQTTRYHYDDRDRLMAETTGTGVPLRSYIWAEDTLLAIAEHAAQAGNPSDIRMLYLELDHLGTPRQARRDGGAIVWRWESDGYGTSAANEDPDGNGQPTTVNLRFPGQYYDEESGLHYNWHRYYVPRLGRYLSSDPIGIEGGINTYAYVGGNPLSFTDPDGRIPLPVITGLIGAGAGAVGNIIGQLSVIKCKPFSWTQLAVATGGGFVAGAVAPYMPGGAFGAAAWGGMSNVGQYWAGSAISGEGVTVSGAAINFGTGVVGGAVGGAVGHASPWSYGRTAASREMVDASNNAANVRLNTGISNLLRNLGGGVVGNAPATDICECMAK